MNFVCLSKETPCQARGSPKPKKRHHAESIAGQAQDTAILLSHRANHTNCHANPDSYRDCVRAGRGRANAFSMRSCPPLEEVARSAGGGV
jgi:hypothetical protein